MYWFSSAKKNEGIYTLPRSFVRFHNHSWQKGRQDLSGTCRCQNWIIANTNIKHFKCSLLVLASPKCNPESTINSDLISFVLVALFNWARDLASREDPRRNRQPLILAHSPLSDLEVASIFWFSPSEEISLSPFSCPLLLQTTFNGLLRLSVRSFVMD